MKILVHSCCGPCTAGVIYRLLRDGTKICKLETSTVKPSDITIFFYNPNIYPKDEYKRRLESAQKTADYFNIKLVDIVGEIFWSKEHENWKKYASNLADAKEGGARCHICYAIRLRKTAEYAKQNGFDFFTSTLGMGPMKDFEKITKIGKAIGEQYGVKYIEENFRKEHGQLKGIELSRELGLYRQNYCGCEYSLK